MAGRSKKIMKWFLWRIPLVIIIVGAVMIGALKVVERYPDPLREGFEDYLSRSTNTEATIGSLEKIQFFPEFDFRALDITMHNSRNAAIIDLEIKEIEIRAPFWSIFLGGNRLYALSIKGFKANKDILSPQEFTLETAKIEEKKGPDQYGAFFITEGSYNDQDMTFEAEVQKENKGYSFPSSIPFSLLLGQSELNANFTKGFTDVALKTAVFKRNKQESEPQEFTLVKSKQYYKDNPLSCLLENGDSDECDIYLKPIE